MKTITEILGGAQALLDINYDLQNCFEERLTDEHKSFLHILRAVEQFLPAYTRPVAQTGRPPYPYYPFARSMLAKSFFGTEKTSAFIQRLKSDPNLRFLCGFSKVPSESTFSRAFALLAEEGIWGTALDGLVKEAHAGKIVFHCQR